MKRYIGYFNVEDSEGFKFRINLLKEKESGKLLVTNENGNEEDFCEFLNRAKENNIGLKFSYN